MLVPVSVALDPTGEKARAVKARYRGRCRSCGAITSPRNGKHDAHVYCHRCRPGAAAPQWTRERVRDALRRWAERYGRAPSSYDWSRTHARRRGEQALRRLDLDDRPAPATVAKLYGSWSRALADAFADPAAPVPPTRPPLERAVRSLTHEIAVRADASIRLQTPSDLDDVALWPRAERHHDRVVGDRVADHREERRR